VSRMRASGVAARGALLATCSLLLAACSGATHVPASPGVPLAQVRAVATQTRFDQVEDRVFEITITNTGQAPFTVSSVRLDAPGFDPVPASLRDEPFQPGDTYDMPAHYGPARCAAATEPARAVVELHRDGGPTGTLRLPLDSPDGLLRRLHDQDCARQDLSRQVHVTLADVRLDGLVLRAAVRVERAGSAAAITATELRDSKLFAFTVSLPARLEASADRLDVPVVVRPAGCYGHLLADVKQPYLFPLFLRFADGAPQYVEVPTTATQREEFQAMLRAACAAAPG